MAVAVLSVASFYGLRSGFVIVLKVVCLFQIVRLFNLTDLLTP